MTGCLSRVNVTYHPGRVACHKGTQLGKGYVMSTTVLLRDALVGRTDDGDRVYVSAVLTVEPVGSRYVETIDHEVLAPEDTVTRLSMSGLIVPRGCRNAYRAGQIVGELDRVTRAARPFTFGDVRSLAAIWRAWHLNDVRAGCAHLPQAVDTSGPSDTWPVCGASGYRYGHAWLYAPLPADGTGSLPGDPLAVLRFIAGRFS